jgi:hypothetical protein
LSTKTDKSEVVPTWPLVGERGATPSHIYEVVRQDDNGNTFTIARGLNEAEALQLVKIMEDRRHKQVYWHRKTSV